MLIYEINDLTKIYPKQSQAANDGISFTVTQGEIFGLLGDNGAGKSTLVKQMANLLRPSSGEIQLMGKPVHADALHVPLHVGYMPQDSRALNSLTVAESLYFTAHLRGMSRRDAQEDRDRLIDLWELGEVRHRPSMKLSGGQKRLMQLAVAMAGAPPVLILDEPTNELAPQRRRHVWETLREQNRTHGTTIIFITHDAIEAEKIIGRVGILRQGRLVALGRPNELKRQIDQQLRLEIFFTSTAAPVLPAGLVPQQLDAGRWFVYLERRQVDGVLEALSRSQIDDFRLYSATLEDLYIHYAQPSD
ncbi:MAG: ABC transporter ATP-binding protein [Caldilineaceae bacterium]|nr:ABC transporter ATP-binding protein [Caldilineaceae bacterium]